MFQCIKVQSLVYICVPEMSVQPEDAGTTPHVNSFQGRFSRQIKRERGLYRSSQPCSEQRMPFMFGKALSRR